MSEVKENYLSKANLIDELVKRVESQMKIRKENPYVKTLIEDLLKYFDYFNSLDEYDKFVFESRISIDDIIIPSELSDFITPASVKRIAGSKICKELLVRVKKYDRDSSEFKSLTINEYDNLIASFRSLFKKDYSDNVVKLSDLKLEVSLESIVGKMSYNGEVRDIGDWYIPINVNTDNDFDTNYFNSTNRAMVSIYIAYLKLN